jgi:hypothetical protein
MGPRELVMSLVRKKNVSSSRTKLSNSLGAIIIP